MVGLGGHRWRAESCGAKSNPMHTTARSHLYESVLAERSGTCCRQRHVISHLRPVPSIAAAVQLRCNWRGAASIPESNPTYSGSTKRVYLRRRRSLTAPCKAEVYCVSVKIRMPNRHTVSRTGATSQLRKGSRRVLSKADVRVLAFQQGQDGSKVFTQLQNGSDIRGIAVEGSMRPRPKEQ